METELFDMELLSELLDLMRLPLGYGFLISASLSLIGYGIFKAFGLLDMKK